MPELAYNGYYVERIDEVKFAEAMCLCPTGALTVDEIIRVDQKITVNRN